MPVLHELLALGSRPGLEVLVTERDGARQAVPLLNGVEFSDLLGRLLIREI